MEVRIASSIAGAAFVAVLASGASPGGTASAAATPKALVYAEKYAEKVKAFHDAGDVYYDVAAKLKTKAVFNVAFDEAAAGAIDGTTTLSLSLGDFFFDEDLAGDPKWTPGKTGAKWVYRDEDDNGRPLKPYLTVTASWKGGRLKVTVKGTEEFLLAENYIGEDAVVSGDPFDADLEFGGFVRYFSGTCSGVASTATVTKQDEGFEVAKVLLAGEGVEVGEEVDFTPPNVVIDFPMDAGTYVGGALSAHVFADDDTSVAEIRYSLNGGAPVSVTFTTTPYPESEGGGVTVDVSFSLSPSTGTNTLVVTVVDGAGNDETDTATFDYAP